MFSRKGKVERAKDSMKDAVAERLPDREQVRDQLSDLTGELADAVEAAQSAITRMASTASRGGRRAGRRAGKTTTKVAEVLAERLPDPDQLADGYRRATDRLFPERAKQHRRAQRKHRRGLVYRGVGLAGLGLLAGWLTAPKRGHEARKALKEQVGKAGANRFQPTDAAGGSGGPAASPVTPLHHDNGVQPADEGLTR